jgi:hypothetical protein
LYCIIILFFLFKDFSFLLTNETFPSAYQSPQSSKCVFKNYCKNRNGGLNWAWWCTPVIPALERRRQEDLKFEVSLGCTAMAPA